MGEMFLIQVAFDFPVSIFLMLVAATIKVSNQKKELRKGKRRINIIQGLIWFSMIFTGFEYANKVGVVKFGTALIKACLRLPNLLAISVTVMLLIMFTTLCGLSSKQNFLTTIGKKMIKLQLEVANVLSN